MMRRGYSRDHRGDCKQVVIALIVNEDGFPLGYETLYKVAVQENSDGLRLEWKLIEAREGAYLLRTKLKEERFFSPNSGTTVDTPTARTSSLPTIDGREIRLRRITTPSAEQQLLLDRLGITLPERFSFDSEV
jgi:hypothetical protein